GDAVVFFDIARNVLVHRRLVRVSPVHQPLGRHAAEHPAQFGNLGDIRLTVERHTFRVETGSQPGGCNLETGTCNARRILTLDEGVIVGHEIEGVDIRTRAGLDGRPDRARVIPQV